MSMRFLISRLSALGDVVHSLPAASALKRGFPDCHITWVVDPRFAGIVECCNAVDEMMIRKPALKPSSWRVPGEYDAALDLQGLLKSGIVVGAAKAKKKIGYHWQREGSWLFSRAVKPGKNSAHVVQQYLDVARSIGGIAEEPDFQLVPKASDRESMRNLLRLHGVQLGEKFVILNSGAGWATKRWPPEYYATLSQLLNEACIPTVFVGGKSDGDREAFASVQAHGATSAIDLLGKTNVRELVALISLAAVHVGGDTGSSHIAAALGIPAVSMFSVTNPDRSCPYGQRHRCFYDPEGLDKILPKQVLTLTLDALEIS